VDERSVERDRVGHLGHHLESCRSAPAGEAIRVWV
jgi:hypothetical protein